jgi:hypothetical protein
MSIDFESIEQRNVVPSGARVKPTCPKCKILLDGEDKCSRCGYVRVKGYDASDPSRDMTGHGFSKSCTFTDLQVNPEKDEIIATEYDFYVDDPHVFCGQCGVPDFTWLMVQRTGVYRSCLRCGRTTGPLSLEFGVMRGSRKVTAEQALAILDERSAKNLDQGKEIQKKFIHRRKITRVDRPRPSELNRKLNSKQASKKA